jgi:hypothetical protein
MWRDTGNAPYPDTIICKDEIWGSRTSDFEDYLLPFGIWCDVVWYVVTNHLEEQTASIFRVEE